MFNATKSTPTQILATIEAFRLLILAQNGNDIQREVEALTYSMSKILVAGDTISDPTAYFMLPLMEDVLRIAQTYKNDIRSMTATQTAALAYRLTLNNYASDEQYRARLGEVFKHSEHGMRISCIAQKMFADYGDNIFSDLAYRVGKTFIAPYLNGCEDVLRGNGHSEWEIKNLCSPAVLQGPLYVKIRNKMQEREDVFAAHRREVKDLLALGLFDRQPLKPKEIFNTNAKADGVHLFTAQYKYEYMRQIQDTNIPTRTVAFNDAELEIIRILDKKQTAEAVRKWALGEKIFRYPSPA